MQRLIHRNPPGERTVKQTHRRANAAGQNRIPAGDTTGAATPDRRGALQCMGRPRLGAGSARRGNGHIPVRIDSTPGALAATGPVPLWKATRNSRWQLPRDASLSDCSY